MRPFEYAAPTSKEQAVELLGTDWSQAAVLAGGTDLLALMKDQVVAPKRVVNLKSVQGLDAITVGSNGELKIGALVRLHELADHPEVRRRFPTIGWAAGEAASPQIRNMATIGGNLCQRPRCWYFRNGMGLLPSTAEGTSLVLQGDNRYHAILGNDGPAYFVSPSTVAPALIAHSATVTIFGSGGHRQLPLEKFYRVPQSEKEREHDLKPDEIVIGITVPAADGTRAAQYEVRQKDQFDWPLALASVALKMSGQRVQWARVVLGAVAPVPWISPEAAEALTGKSIDDQTADAAGRAAVSKAKPLSRNRYKVHLTRVAVKRAVLEAVAGGKA